MAERAPLVVVIAGPNGAGKSTTAPRLLQEALTVTEFVNADPIAIGLSAFRPQSVAMAAGRVMLALSGPDLAVARVAERVRQGGHDVPGPVVRRRFVTGLKNFFSLYQAVSDTWQIFDNSTVDGPRLIATGRAGQPPRVLDAETWADLQEKQR